MSNKTAFWDRHQAKIRAWARKNLPGAYAQYEDCRIGWEPLLAACMARGDDFFHSLHLA